MMIITKVYLEASPGPSEVCSDPWGKAKEEDNEEDIIKKLNLKTMVDIAVVTDWLKDVFLDSDELHKSENLINVSLLTCFIDLHWWKYIENIE